MIEIKLGFGNYIRDNHKEISEQSFHEYLAQNTQIKNTYEEIFKN